MSSAVQYIHNINTLNASSKQQKHNEKKKHILQSLKTYYTRQKV